MKDRNLVDALTSVAADQPGAMLNMYKVVIALAVPVILEQFSRIAAQYVDAAMVGGIGVYATAAVGINASTSVLLNGILMSLGIGFSVRAAMAIGASDRDEASAIARAGIIFSFIAGVLISGAMQFIGMRSPVWLGAEADVAPFASDYIRIVAGAYVFQAVSVTAAALLRGAGDTRTPFRVNLLANIVNIIGNFFLISNTRVISLLGFPAIVPGAGLGVHGAALATAASIIFSGIAMLRALFRTSTAVNIRHAAVRPIRDTIAPAIKLSIPMALERMTLAAGHIMMTAIVAALGTDAMAAHHIVNTASTISYETAMGFAHAATALSAQCSGAGMRTMVGRCAAVCARVGALISAVLSALVFVFAPQLVGLFTASAAVISLGTLVIRMDAVSEPMFSISTVLCGVFRGCGDARYPFWVSFFGVIVTRLTFGCLFAFVFGLGLAGVWGGIFIDIILRGIMCLLHLRKMPAIQSS